MFYFYFIINFYFTLGINDLLAFLLMAGHLRCPANSLMKKEEDIGESNESVIIIVGQKFAIVIEGKKVVECVDLLKTFFLFFASFWIFNLEYPKKTQTFMKFIQNNILGIEDGKTDSKILKFIAKLNRQGN